MGHSGGGNDRPQAGGANLSWSLKETRVWGLAGCEGAKQKRKLLGRRAKNQILPLALLLAHDMT